MHKAGNPFIDELRDSLAKRTETTQNADEVTVLAHMRGWCHHAPSCALCQTQKREIEYMQRAHRAENTLNAIISGG